MKSQRPGDSKEIAGKGSDGCAGKERWYSMEYERSRSSPLGLGGKSEFQRILIKGEGEGCLQHSCVGHSPSHFPQNTPDSLLGSYGQAAS